MYVSYKLANGHTQMFTQKSGGLPWYVPLPLQPHPPGPMDSTFQNMSQIYFPESSAFTSFWNPSSSVTWTTEAPLHIHSRLWQPSNHPKNCYIMTCFSLKLFPIAFYCFYHKDPNFSHSQPDPSGSALPPLIISSHFHSHLGHAFLCALFYLPSLPSSVRFNDTSPEWPS